MTQTIPASYLAAGRLTYEDDFGTILWSVSWGRPRNYTGPETGSIVQLTPTENFGPAFSGPLPSNEYPGAPAVYGRGRGLPALTMPRDYALDERLGHIH